MKTYRPRANAQKSQKKSPLTDIFELFVHFCGYDFLSNTQVKHKFL